MSIPTVETSSHVEDRERGLQTRDTNVEDWVLPTIERDQSSAGETSTSPPKEAPLTTFQSQDRKVSPPVRKDDLTIRLPSDHVKLLQQWECAVLSVRDDCVECEMHDLTDESKPIEYAEVYLDEFNLFDRELLCEGAVFYWSIGHEIRKTGQVRRYSELRVRRMPPLSISRRREITQRAKDLSELIGNDS